MDKGHFLTDSGSKIPQLKPKDTALKIPQKPNLTASTIKKTNYVEPTVEKAKTSNLQRSRNIGVAKSIPNLTKSTALTRSKTSINKPTVSSTNKRQASNDDVEASAAKIPKTANKTGFNYKAKTWELKLRLAECEEWVTDLRSHVKELEEEMMSNSEELNSLREVRSQLQNEEARANDLQEQLLSKTSDFDKLHSDSKNFLDTIQQLELEVKKKQSEQTQLQADLTKLREECLANSSEVSKLRFSLDDVEFKFRRQKNTLDDVEACFAQSKKECSDLQSRLRERDALLSETQDKLERSERDNKMKNNTIRDLEEELFNARSRISDLEKDTRGVKDVNQSLSSNVESLKEQLAETKRSEIELTRNCEEMRGKLCDSEKFRRFLHNQVQDLKGNIRVFCRVRPPLPSEKENLMCTINYPDEGTIEVSKADPFEHTNSSVTSRPKFQKHEYCFDRVFNPSSTQAMVFEELSQLVQSALDGYNVCIFAYGQTGSGKTYTMEGPNNSEARGMIPRTVLHIFETVANLEKLGWEYTVEVCFIEIYNEVIRDLLRSDKDGANLKIMQVDGKTNDVLIPGLTVMQVKSYEDLDRLYVLAHQNRAVASTCYNERSSRSHSVTKIKVTGVHKERGETCYGSLNLVDLAGSERLSESTSANDPRIREMKNINKSLSELGNVILGLYQKNEHIPYRNSKLTHLLQPALGGSSKTLMLVNISPVESCMPETLCSLRFAQKVNQVKVGTSKKRITYDAAVPK